MDNTEEMLDALYRQTRDGQERFVPAVIWDKGIEIIPQEIRTGGMMKKIIEVIKPRSGDDWVEVGAGDGHVVLSITCGVEAFRARLTLGETRRLVQAIKDATREVGK